MADLVLSRINALPSRARPAGCSAVSGVDGGTFEGVVVQDEQVVDLQVERVGRVLGLLQRSPGGGGGGGGGAAAHGRAAARLHAVHAHRDHAERLPTCTNTLFSCSINSLKTVIAKKLSQFSRHSVGEDDESSFTTSASN